MRHTAKIIPFPQPQRPEEPPPSGAGRPRAKAIAETKDERLARMRREMALAMAKPCVPSAEQLALYARIERALLDWEADGHDVIWVRDGSVVSAKKEDVRGLCWPIRTWSGNSLNPAAVEQVRLAWTGRWMEAA